MKAIFLSLLVLWGPYLFAYGPQVPDRQMTGGSFCTKDDPDFDGFRYRAKLAHCARNVDRNKKTRVYEAYGIPPNCQIQYTIDHLIPLSIGGTNHIDNLWPEHKSIKKSRLYFEQEIVEAIMAGEADQETLVRRVYEEKFDPKNRRESGPSNCN